MSSTDSLISGQCPPKPAHRFSNLSSTGTGTRTGTGTSQLRSPSNHELSSQRLTNFVQEPLASSNRRSTVWTAGTSATGSTSSRQAQDEMEEQINGIMTPFGSN
ncbi:hypothetical protein SUNI508_05095 [Seiridium unicorne]|uniref:Uncharacterized protein n=1 Tax=Seiridium unicorne TaxID=138068 RepID=A0ABR2V597_9PEZI